MREIECVRVASTSPTLESYLKKLVKEADSDIKFIDWEKPVIDLHAPLILVVEAGQLLKLKAIAETRKEKIIIALNSRKDFKLVSELNSYFEKIFGFIDLSQETEYNIPLLKNYLNMNFSKHAIKLSQLASDLDKIYEHTRSELTRIKDFHDRFVKVRADQLKGGALLSKFMAGEKSGGEFFEIIQNENEILFVQAGSSSYILSSIILGEFESLKEHSKANQLKPHLENFLKIINQHAAENKAELSYSVLNLNLKTLEANIMCKGSGYMVFQGEFRSLDQSMKLSLKPKERLCLVSQGAMKNWELLSKLSAKKFFSDNREMSSRDLINEFFFEVSRNKTGNFLVYDALIAVIEIDENILYQLS